VTHAVVKRVYCELRHPEDRPRRLALFTLAEVEEGELEGEKEEDGKQETGEGGAGRKLHTSPRSAIDVTEEVSEADLAAGRAALECYRTYQDVIRRADPLGRVGSTLYFELFQESHSPPLPSITAGL